MPKLSAMKRSGRHGWFRAIARRFGAIRADSTGGVTLFLALSLPAMIGFAGLGTEAANWYLTKRTMQGAADAAASAAATALAAGTSNWSIVASEAKAIATYYDFVNGNNGTIVRVNPPSSGAYQGNSNAVEVVISKQEPALLSALFLPQGPTITARAVALADRSLTAEACVVALDTKNEMGMTTWGTTDLIFPGCSLYVNSPASNALNIGGNAKINAKTAYIVGQKSGEGLTTAEGPYFGVNPLIDPYRDITIPPYTRCTSETTYHPNSNVTVTPETSEVHVFCGGLKLTGNVSLTLRRGTYIIAGGDLNIESGSLTAKEGTTIILKRSDIDNKCPTVKINSGPIEIVAPTSGDLAGVAIYKDRTCVNRDSADDKIAGNAAKNITGAIYFPEQYIEYTGGSATGGAQCTQLIAWRIKFIGTSAFENNCKDKGTRKLVLTGSRLVE
jgi:Flp pilus assembly protein TadG